LSNYQFNDVSKFFAIALIVEENHIMEQEANRISREIRQDDKRRWNTYIDLVFE
jgi:hypothetical protein